MENVAIKKVLVVGAGTMGYSLALTFAKGGFDVFLVDRENQILLNARKLIDSALETLQQARLITDGEIRKVISRIKISTNLVEATREADLVIEAVTENPSIKKDIFHLLDVNCPKHTILASNTSYLNIFDIAETGRPDKVLIAHWFAPPHIIPLVEIVAGDRTSSETVETVKEVLEKLGKKTIMLNRYIPGFLVNRIQRAIQREAFYLLDNNYASIEDIDTALKASLGIRLPIVGVLQSMDFAGLDLAYATRKTTPIELAPHSGLPKIVEQKVKRGELGVKTGKGLYDYSGRSTEEVLRQRDLKYLKILKALEDASKE
jgi:3-hydroxybutyryl-CoA dehydrogenase